MSIFFSIVVPCLNEERDLPILLKSIIAQTYRNFEVIIVDSGSKDKTKENFLKLEKKLPNCRFINEKLKNVSIARNFGASLAKGEYLIFFDADVEIEKNFLEEIERRISEFKLDDLTVWNRPRKNSSLKGRFLLILMNLCLSICQYFKPAANGPCIIMKKDIFEKTGRFDEEIFFGEDFDLIQRAKKIGAKFAVFAEPILYGSTRRFDKEGLFISLYKAIKGILHQLFIGPVRKEIFRYEMGGQYYKKDTR